MWHPVRDQHGLVYVCVVQVPDYFFITELHFARIEPPSKLLSVLEGIGSVEKYFTRTDTSLTEFAVLMPLYIPPDDDLVEFKKCMRNVSDKRLFIIDCAVCWLEYCVIHGARCS
jgi:hypothetical protein